MSGSIELAAIRARDAGIGNDAAFHRTISQVYLDRRTLLRMLDEARKRTAFLEEMGIECANDWQKIEALVKERDEARAELAACKIARGGFITASDAAFAENEKLRAELVRLREKYQHHD